LSRALRFRAGARFFAGRSLGLPLRVPSGTHRKIVMSRLNQTLILLALTIQLLVVCGDLAAPAEHDPISARDVDPKPAVTAEPPAPAPFVACYEREPR
jgi:hypothetical protein